MIHLPYSLLSGPHETISPRFKLISFNSFQASEVLFASQQKQVPNINMLENSSDSL